ncbi:hypothetical protein ASG87_03545 [Frateuria sp. Soil773]|uniref:DUF3472 domain-containing protein n=1 Tax=Frateuria sp. Soil773 TaxID=1736407 RepID=UPI0006F60792|nr:DUF5077 domain-containing protein [Frateuria sp. Soil773]KRE89425.1 hypothetical protein ASG87_03545 [Frateuria sp. Soil773]
MRNLACAGLGLLLLLSGRTSAAQDAAITVPLGGNAYVTHPSPADDELIDDTGLHNWSSDKAVTSVYFDVRKPGQLQLSLVGTLNGASHSTVLVSVGAQSRLVFLSSTAAAPFPAGSFFIPKAGYVKVDLRGVYTDGGYYGDISGLQIGGSATAAGTVFANDPDNFYWSRRGPSVHLGFDVPADTEYFYSEVTVPKGQDPIGSYYMANGFNTGYFGIQVNSATERRVLFSVWDSPTGRTTLVRKGPDVVSNDFDGEGTGGQSYLVFKWSAGQTYRFLTRAQPDGEGNTVYTAWFGTPCLAGHGDCGWKLIASWKYLGASTYLKGVYSFLESFDPERGYIGRSALYGNEWAITADGTWSEVKSAYFDVDPTGLNKQRLDFAGGSLGPLFYLRNDGFFSHSTASGQTFTRSPAWFRPRVDLGKLP